DPAPYMADVRNSAPLVVTPHDAGHQASRKRRETSWMHLLEFTDQVILFEATRADTVMNHVWLALEERCPVFAVPGPVQSRFSDGPNSLIVTGDAQAIINPSMLA